jgi:RNA 3'-terminal phosphate cyclase (ATP)
MIQIDGSYGEGGGQIIRTGVALAALTGKALEVVAVRARRSRTGLQRQHLTAVRAAAQICRAKLEGDEVGSLRFAFLPESPVQSGEYRFDIGTAGATALVLQTLMLPLLLAKGDSVVTITGGTHVPHAPTVDYLRYLYAPALAKMGATLQIDSAVPGFFPKGGGEAEARLTGGANLLPLNLTRRGKLASLQAHIVTTQLPSHVAVRGKAAVERFMKGVGRPVQTVITEATEAKRGSPGAAITITARCEEGLAGFSSLGEQGKPMERVVGEACEAFMGWWKSGGACDTHLSDQLVLPLSLARGESVWTTKEVTEHLRTVLHVTEQFLPIRYTVEQTEDSLWRVTLRGAGRD